MREAFSNILMKIGEENSDLYVLNADLSSSSGTDKFAKKFPERFINVGIAEQNMIGIASGLMNVGKRCIIGGFCIFTVGLGFNIIRLCVANGFLPKICCTHSGLSNCYDGQSHQPIDDIGLMGSIPGMRIYCPGDEREIEPILQQMMVSSSPCYLRLNRNPVSPLPLRDFGPYPQTMFKTGEEITIISTGVMSCQMQKVHELLDIPHTIIHTPIISPINIKSKYLVTVEDHIVNTGFGSQIARKIAKTRPIQVLNIGLEDFGQSGHIDDLYKHYGLDPESIVRKIKEWKKL